MNGLTNPKRFHGSLDAEPVATPGGVVTTTVTKHLIIQERDVSYRFHSHFHPYAGHLVQRLLRKSTAGLQAADTDYVPDGAALPGSIEITLGNNGAATMRVSSPVVLIGNVHVSFPGAASIELAGGTALTVRDLTQGILPDGMRATLLDGMDSTPAAGSRFALTDDMSAVASNDVRVTLPLETAVTLQDGTEAYIPGGTTVTLPGGTPVVITNGTEVTLLSIKPRPVLYGDVFSPTRYDPSALVQQPYPVKELDFSVSGAYSAYNWELFFHVPLTIAIHLSKNQRFAEAQRWFHFLFDPTDDSDGPTPERFWKVRPFQTTDVRKIEEIFVNLVTGADPALRDETIRSIEAWKDAPFRPHLVARYRQQAYMAKTVMAYLDNLIAWGDSLFRQDTGEAIDEALMLYVLAANILGPRPLPVPRKGSVRPQTYFHLRADLDAFGNAIREMEADVPFDLMPFPAEGAADTERLATLRSLGKALYFCVPRNDKLLGYWDTVDDRLFKIRNSLNLQGVFRQLALFEPPLDPAMLARGAAAGLDVGAIVNGFDQPLPLVRFQLLVQKAAEICQEVKALGSHLLSAMEREDGEALGILRARHERIVMEMVEQVRYAQVQEAIKSKEGLLQSLDLAVQRYVYYERQLGKKADEVEKGIPQLSSLDKASLERMKFSMKEPRVVVRDVRVDIAQDLGDSGGKIVSSHESRELATLAEARDLQDVVQGISLGGQAISVLPQFGIKFHFWGLGGDSNYGGFNLGKIAQFAADAASAWADRKIYEANNIAKVGSYARREQEWTFQSNMAAGEVTQIFKQLRAAEIRQAITELELKNHRQQMKHAEEIEGFLNEEGTDTKGKKANKALHAWMKREVKGLYGQCFQLAFDIARKAERALQHELGNPALSFLQFGYLAGKEGLVAGEKLHLDIKRMEMAYHDLNQREYELTKHVSLLQVSPFALLQLRVTGRCTVTLPETLFDIDGPGHYFRRIKTVAVSIPCVTGPYASVNCTLTLIKSSIRKTAAIGGGDYARPDPPAGDNRFDDYFGSQQSIITSSAQNDSGLFEASLRDERYLPFENSGVLSEWRLELPADPSKGGPQQFDYETISDVILHLRYTAREGGGLLRKGAADNLKTAVETVGSVRLFSVRHEFPTEWARFHGQPGASERFELALRLRSEHYPFWSQGRLKSVKEVRILARSTRTPIPANLEVFDRESDHPQAAKKDNLTRTSDPALGSLLDGTLSAITLPTTPVGDLTLFFSDRDLEDVWIALTWSS
jgi:hypothetical protein